jgi:uncharacterized protein YhhL (DUF1145 family)
MDVNFQKVNNIFKLFTLLFWSVVVWNFFFLVPSWSEVITLSGLIILFSHTVEILFFQKLWLNHSKNQFRSGMSILVFGFFSITEMKMKASKSKL